MSWDDLCGDLQDAILNRVVRDTRGHVTVPGLVVGTGLRGVSKHVASRFAAIETPYDGQVSFEGSWPIWFRGGLGFGDVSDCVEGPPTFFVVRDPKSGYVFACTVKDGQRCDDVRHIESLWPLWRMARLLNGHCADLGEQLDDVIAVAEGARVQVPRKSLHFHQGSHINFAASRKVETLSHNGLNAPAHVNANDFISQKVEMDEWRDPVLGRGKFVKTTNLVLASAVGNGHRVRFLDVCFPSPIEHAVQVGGEGREVVHQLSIALGWYDLGEVVQLTGWMTSLYCHGRVHPVPKHYRARMSEVTLKSMARCAKRCVEKQRAKNAIEFSAAAAAAAAAAASAITTIVVAHGTSGGKKRSHPCDGPSARVVRQPRNAALRAKRLISDVMQYDAWQNADGRFMSYLKPKATRDREEAGGDVDDQYATPGALVTPDADSDGEFGLEQGEALTRSEQRTKNHAEAVALSLRKHSEMLVPSDEE
tara:strand:+ start:405 stop:1838 length:1434 start_codon:yes stop_codon:yes gene_type:complete